MEHSIQVKIAVGVDTVTYTFIANERRRVLCTLTISPEQYDMVHREADGHNKFGIMEDIKYNRSEQVSINVTKSNVVYTFRSQEDQELLGSIIITLDEHQDALENGMDDVVAMYIDYMQEGLDRYYFINFN